MVTEKQKSLIIVRVLSQKRVVLRDCSTVSFEKLMDKQQMGIVKNRGRQKCRHTSSIASRRMGTNVQVKVRPKIAYRIPSSAAIYRTLNLRHRMIRGDVIRANSELLRGLNLLAECGFSPSLLRCLSWEEIERYLREGITEELEREFCSDCADINAVIESMKEAWYNVYSAGKEETVINSGVLK